MSITLATALVAATVTLPSCSWDRPGADPYMGDIEAAVDRYRDIPPDVRARLKAKMRQRAYDDIAAITRDKIEGKRSYSNLRDMHFGNGRVCREVGRSKWKPEAVERGLVYCEGEHCLIVPTVCRNVSRVTLEQAHNPKTAAGPADEPLDLPSSGGPNMLRGQRFLDETDPLPARIRSLEPPPGELTFDPPALGQEPPPELPREPLPDPSPPIPPPPIPEPSTWALMALGLAMVARQARRARASS
ncbi:MAG: hypothetical protein RI988_3877 [Pseudomonadota bacterium]|jgi:hypothetical protein